VAACLGLTWGFAHQNLGASTQASSPATTTPPQQGYGRDDGGYLTQPNPDYGAVPGMSGGGANTTSGGS
jgi:hypothetical protein